MGFHPLLLAGLRFEARDSSCVFSPDLTSALSRRVAAAMASFKLSLRSSLWIRGGGGKSFFSEDMVKI